MEAGSWAGVVNAGTGAWWHALWQLVTFCSVGICVVHGVVLCGTVGSMSPLRCAAKDSLHLHVVWL